MTQTVSVQPEWASRLPIQQQSVLFLATRGPDGMAKHHPAKALIRAYRACVLNGAAVGRPLRVSEEGDTFMSAHYLRPEVWGITVQMYFDHIDEIPHHYHLHLMHGIEILGYKHPSEFIRKCWLGVYLDMVHDAHLYPESEAQMDERLNDFGRPRAIGGEASTVTSTEQIVRESVEEAVNSCYGTDPRHGLLASAVADRIVYGKPIPWGLSKHFGRDG